MNPIERRGIRWCHLSTKPGTTPQCLVNEGNVNFSGTRSLVNPNSYTLSPVWRGSGGGGGGGGGGGSYIQ